MPDLWESLELCGFYVTLTAFPFVRIGRRVALAWGWWYGVENKALPLLCAHHGAFFHEDRDQHYV